MRKRPESRFAIWKKHKEPFSLATIPIADWNRDLSPRAAPRVFKGGEDFGGGADKLLEGDRGARRESVSAVYLYRGVGGAAMVFDFKAVPTATVDELPAPKKR